MRRKKVFSISIVCEPRSWPYADGCCTPFGLPMGVCVCASCERERDRVRVSWTGNCLIQRSLHLQDADACAGAATKWRSSHPDRNCVYTRIWNCPSVRPEWQREKEEGGGDEYRCKCQLAHANFHLGHFNARRLLDLLMQVAHGADEMLANKFMRINQKIESCRKAGSPDSGPNAPMPSPRCT